jgi:hypothetical protein
MDRDVGSGGDVSAFKNCNKHGAFFSTFPECPYCEQDRAAPPARTPTPVQIPAPVAKFVGGSGPHSQPHRGPKRGKHMPLPSPRIVTPAWHLSRKASLVLGTLAIMAAVVLTVFNPFLMIVPLAIAALFLFR